jgi:hypothetical protein
MDTLLIMVAALSLAMAMGMAIVAAKLLREDRARSEARVAALGAMAGEPPPPARVMTSEPLPAPRHAARTQAATRPATPPRSIPAVPLEELEIRPAEAAVPGVRDLFANERPSSRGRNRFGVIATLAMIVAAVGVALVYGVGGRSATAPAAAAPVPTATEPAPLELVSLRYAREAQSLTVTGLVQNPRTGAPLSRLVATAFVFGSDGSFLASGRAPIDFTTLAPGDESPFVVTVPVNAEVARYRIGFRGEDGRVVAHVDRRAPESLVSTRK